MKFETLTKREAIKQVPDRWRLQYGGLLGNGWYPGKEHVYEDLKKLDLDTCSEQDITKIVGNGSWTRLTCNHCNQDVDKICLLESHSQDEYGSCSYCVDCLRGALKEMEKL